MLKPTIGIEVHAELLTKNKSFSKAERSYTAVPNTNVTPFDIALPGTLPVINKEVVTKALKAALALNSKINKEMYFERKHYFYRDLSKGYQISQDMTPIGYDGNVLVNNKLIELERVHIEEDTAKSTHMSTYSLLDFNRAGNPLIEIVTKPVITSSEEAVDYLTNLREILLHTEVSDVLIEEGSMRCDVNISLSSDTSLGTKVEIKNIGSISNVKKAIDFEIIRQTSLINEGKEILASTRRFDDNTSTTIHMRDKEEVDNRFIVDPSFPKLVLTDEYISSVRKSINTLPNQLRIDYNNLGLNQNAINTLMTSLSLNKLFLELKSDKVVGANFLTGLVLEYLNKEKLSIDDTFLTAKRLDELITLLEEKKVPSNSAKLVIPLLLKTNKELDIIIKELKLDDNLSEEETEKVISLIIASNEDSVKDFIEGKDRATKFLMGQFMKETKGKGDPKIGNEVLLKLLNKRKEEI